MNEAELHFSGDSLQLSVKRIRFDYVNEVQDPNPILREHDWLYCDLEQWIGDILPTIGPNLRCDHTAPSLNERCLRTMSADRSAWSTRDVRSSNKTRFPLHYQWARSKHAEDSPPTEVLDELARFIGAYMGQRALFLSKRGYLGIGPETMQSGDIVCVFLGGDTPFILRPKDTGEYTFIGEAYVDGIMDGETLLGILADKYEEFVLR